MDNHATTPLDPRVLEAMMPYFGPVFGNAASTGHAYGREARTRVEEARASVARLIGAMGDEIIFTSGATESNNLAIKGICECYREKGNHIITQVTEHKAVLDTCRYLEKKGIRVTWLEVDAKGRVSPEAVRQAITEKTVLISMMHANNEIGTFQPIAEIGKIAREHRILFHVDGAQTAGKVEVDVNALGVDLYALSAHKLYGPKGVGALFVRRENPRVRLECMLHGGGHEGGMRSGTLNVPGIIGFARACELAGESMKEEYVRIARLRDRLREGFAKELGHVRENGDPSNRLAGNLNMTFEYVDADPLLAKIGSDVAVSSGSACSSQNPEPSHVLKAIGALKGAGEVALRFGLGRFTTPEEVEYVICRVASAVRELREESPFYRMAQEES